MYDLQESLSDMYLHCTELYCVRYVYAPVHIRQRHVFVTVGLCTYRTRRLKANIVANIYFPLGHNIGAVFENLICRQN